VFKDNRSRQKEDDHEKETRDPYEEMGKPEMQLDWLKKITE